MKAGTSQRRRSGTRDRSDIERLETRWLLSAPFGGTPAPVPGRIEAENFDTGGEGVAYHDTDAANLGGAYRPSEGVDLQATGDAGSGGYNVGWAHAGEWLNYTVNVTAGGTYDFAARVADAGSGAAFHVEVDGVNVTGSIAIPDTGGFQNYATVTKSGIALTAGQHVLRFVFDANNPSGYAGNVNWLQLTTNTSTPFSGSPIAIAASGTSTIEAENFDNGGEGVAYHDTEPANLGGAYRPGEGVDLQSTGDAGGGYNVGWTHAGEWLKYTVNVAALGKYDLAARVADIGSGAAFHVEVDGVNVTGTLAIPDTGSFTAYTTVKATGISLTAGQHVIRLVFDANGPTGYAGNVNWLQLTASAAPTSTPFGGTPAAVPGAIEAENYDVGGEGVAYHDTEAANLGGAYRTGEGVDIEPTGDSGGGYDVGWAKAGEWMNYTIQVATAGTYTLDSRVASPAAGGAFHVSFNGGSVVTPAIAIPNTGGWQTYTDVLTGGISLPAGTYLMTVFVDANGATGFAGNFNRFTFSTTPITSGAQPDLLIRNYGDANYIGAGVINQTAINQVTGQDQPFFPSIFQARVTNAGSKADSFRITGPASPTANWRVWYYDSQVQARAGGNDITAQVTSGGWTTPVLQPGQSYDFRFEMGASALDPANDRLAVRVTATSTSDPSKSDVIQGVATNDPRDEVEVRRRNYAQVTGESGTYLLDLQNYGNRPDQYVVKATGSGTGYTVRYFNAYSGGSDITSQVTGAGWTTPQLAYHAIQNMAVQIVSTDGHAHSIQFTVTSTNNSGVTRTITISNTTPKTATPCFFPIGVWDQPTVTFDTWKGRGINTVVQYDSYGGTQSIDYWSQIALDKGFKMIREASPNPADDLKWSNLLAWMQPDEPELRSDFPPSSAQALYSQLKAVNPNVPVYVNFDASDFVGWQHDATPATYQQYINQADWISGGMYPISGWNRPDDLDVMGRALDRMEAMDQGAPTFAIIESSNQLGPWLPPGSPSPTPAQVRAEVWDTVIHGARGIIYFPQSFTPGFSYDNTAPDVAVEITNINAQLTSIGAALESPIDPPTAGVTANAPLEATWRTFGGHNYYVVFNYSNGTVTQQVALKGAGSAGSATVQGESRSVALSNGTFTDTFAPYQVHIYVV